MIYFKHWLENNETTEIFSKLDAFYDSLPEDKKINCSKSMAIIKNLIQKANDSFLNTKEYKELKQSLSYCESYLPHMNNFYELYEAMREKRKSPVADMWGVFNFLPPQNEEEKLMDQIFDASYSFGKISSIAKSKKKQQILDKMPAVRDDIKMFMDTRTPFQEIKEYVENLKSKVKDAKQLKQEKQDELERKRAEELKATPQEVINAELEVKKQIEDMISSFENNYKTNFINVLTSRVENFVQTNAEKLKNPAISKNDLERIKDDAKQYYYLIDAWLLSSQNSLKLKPDYKKAIEKMANSSWESMKEFFVIRMQEKLVPIVKAKASQTHSSDFTLKKLFLQTDYNLIEGKFNLTFADGSYFDVTHKAVSKYSIYNKQFNQFPTRFSNIQMADGSYHNALPADELYRKFAGIAPPKEEPEMHSI